MKKKRSRITLSLIILLFTLLVLSGAFFIIFDVGNWQKLDPSRLSQLSQTSVIFDDDGELLSELRSEEHRQIIPLSDIPLLAPGWL